MCLSLSLFLSVSPFSAFCAARSPSPTPVFDSMGLSLGMWPIPPLHGAACGVGSGVGELWVVVPPMTGTSLVL